MDMPVVHPLLEVTFSAFNQEHIRWCVLRGEGELACPGPDDDVDLLVAPDDMPRVRAVLDAQQYVALPTRGRGSHRFFIGYHSPTNTWIKLDIVTELTYGPYLSLRTNAATGCLARRGRRELLNVPASDDAFWLLFLHCMLDKGKFAPHRAAALRELVGAARTDGPFAQVVGPACPRGWDLARLIESVRQGDWEALTRLAPALAVEWRRREPIAARWREISNRVLRRLEIPLTCLQRPGVSVALLGPHGVGKSTLVAEIRRSFHFPVRSVYMGLCNSAPTPARTAVRPTLLGWSVARRRIEIGLRLPKAWRGYLVAKLHQAAGRVVIFDRYAYDALVPARASSGLLKGLHMRLLGHSCPAPDLVLVLDAPGEVMSAREGEDSPEALETQRQRLLALRDRIQHVQVVDATRDEAAVRADVLGRIWAACCARWAR
jgi:thymidylate kinase